MRAIFAVLLLYEEWLGRAKYLKNKKVGEKKRDTFNYS